MPTIKLALDPEAFDALSAAASANLRPPDWHAEALLRQALGLSFPLAAEPQRAKEPTEAHR